MQSKWVFMFVALSVLTGKCNQSGLDKQEMCAEMIFCTDFRNVRILAKARHEELMVWRTFSSETQWGTKHLTLKICKHTTRMLVYQKLNTKKLCQIICCAPTLLCSKFRVFVKYSDAIGDLH